MDLEFLNDLEMEELEGKDEVIKSIRFSKEEFYMLKYCKHINKRFATYVKELMEQDIKNDSRGYDFDIEKLKQELKQELKEELLEELKQMNESAYNLEKDKEESKAISENRKEVMNFLQNRN